MMEAQPLVRGWREVVPRSAGMSPRWGALWALAATFPLLAGCPGGGPTPIVIDSDVEVDSGADTDDVVEVLPSESDPWLRREVAAPGSVTFTELHYHPATQQDLEWIEFHNPMVFDMDLSGWSLEGGVEITFAEGTLLPAGGYLVVAADPALLEAETGFAEALGPYEGRLSNSGERLELHSHSGRRIDTVEYADDDPWPVGPDGSGATLAKLDPDAASDHAENWAVSTELGGTPGESNLLDPLEPPTTQVASSATSTDPSTRAS